MKALFNLSIRRICLLLQWIDMHIMCALSAIKRIMAVRLDVMRKWETNIIHKNSFVAVAVMLQGPRYFKTAK